MCEQVRPVMPEAFALLISLIKGIYNKFIKKIEVSFMMSSDF